MSTRDITDAPLSELQKQQRKAAQIAEVVSDLAAAARSVSDIVLPSRKLLPDGSVNPDYNPTLDPGSSDFRPDVFFELRPQVEIYVMPDPENPNIEWVPSDVAGFRLELDVKQTHEVPIDHAEALILSGTAILASSSRKGKGRRGRGR